ncbi:LysM peptidoglycan-binding domain-containing protein [Cytobacillus sp. NCCP-133]|uniref:LysM peptidoglycan-binding domain-containing protein n=1 Tax=Cytobacillus sp. NCCP-133 TaxID=766848 RepID=UPI002231E712|nr:LysM peptidoglycan-binding domain-containing protein [Cytobacillus sp. NCCP-133]GLB58029.1 hypothetical protein NCCP133_01620 [Cytobacillus sp. NCCP-133]
MNKEGPYRDQAERLRRKIDRKLESDSSGQKAALPPRSRIHQEKRNKNKWKVKYPVIRLLSLFYILLPITIFSIYSYLSKEKGMGVAEEAASVETGFETVGYAPRDADKGTTIEVREESGELGSPGQEAFSEEYVEEKKHLETQTSSQIDDSEDKGSAVQLKQEEQQKEVEKEKAAAENSEKIKGQEEPKTEGKIIYHTVKPQETIFRIAMNYYKSQAGIDIIKQANNLQSNEIQTGQVLKVPLNQ